MEYFHQPNIDPVIFKLWGPLQIRWYSLFYVGSFIIGSLLLKRLSKEKRFLFDEKQVEQITVWLLVGVVIGARLFYCMIYDSYHFFSNPFTFFKVYQGGLSFHGGLIGTIVAMLLFSRAQRIPFFNIMDGLALVTPIGLALGRIGNFINGELYGRVTDVPWAVIFRNGGPLPRHPSQIYEFFLEGILILIILWCVKKKLNTNGQLSFLFLFLYSTFRFIVEFFREPDAHIGYVILGLSMGQVLSLIMLILSAGAYSMITKKSET